MYEVLVIDPPWPKKKGGLRAVRPNQGRSLDYKTMPTQNIFRVLDDGVLPLAAPIHNVFLWSIDSFLMESESFMSARGYKRHARIVWDKVNGVAPAFTLRFTHEYLIWFYKPKLLPVSHDIRGKLTTVIREKARQHSRKPDAAYLAIKSLYPKSAAIDVFSREPRSGWDQWGDQCSHFS